MSKALIVTTVSGFVPEFELNNVKILQSLGYEVHYASNFNTPVYGEDNSRLEGTGIFCHHIEFTRSPFSARNIHAYKELKKLMRAIRFDIVHCHTPMGALHSRLAAKVTNTKPVIYTAHGFHFYQGAPLINHILYGIMEKFLANYTDALITINKEDYATAKKFHFRPSGKAFYIPGVGIDVEKFELNSVIRAGKRIELGISENEIMLLSVGELNNNKNHEIIIKAISDIDIPYKYVICGKGNKYEYLKKLVTKLKIEEKVIFAGYRNDVQGILMAADIFCFPSKREGLSVSLMEAMTIGLPVVCSNIRGNIDLINNGKGGYLVNSDDTEAFRMAILKLMENRKLSIEMGQYNADKIKQFDKSVVDKKMLQIYSYIKTSSY